MSASRALTLLVVCTSTGMTFTPELTTRVSCSGTWSVRAQQARKKLQHTHSNQRQSTRQAMQQQAGEKERERGQREKERKDEGGKEEERREAEEAEHEQVKKDVTGWTVVTRSEKHRKTTVQIFVKVDGPK